MYKAIVMDLAGKFVPLLENSTKTKKQKQVSFETATLKKENNE